MAKCADIFCTPTVGASICRFMEVGMIGDFSFFVAWINVVFSWTVGSCMGVVLLRKFAYFQRVPRFVVHRKIMYGGVIVFSAIYVYLLYVAPIIILISNHYLR